MLLTVLKSSHYHSSGQGEEFSSVFLLRKIAARCELLKKYTPPPLPQPLNGFNYRYAVCPVPGFELIYLPALPVQMLAVK